MMTDPQTAADAAERVHDAELVEILADHGIHVDGSCAACRGLDIALLAWREVGRARMAAELEQVRAQQAAVEGAWRCWHCGTEHGPVLCTACVDRVAEKARDAARAAETTATRPAGGSDRTGEGQRTDTGAREAQRGSQGDAVDARCRSCGGTDRVLGNPPLCSNCAAYGPAEPFSAVVIAPRTGDEREGGGGE